jgi:hypothetical protein
MLQKGIALTRSYAILEPCSRELRLLDRAVNGCGCGDSQEMNSAQGGMRAVAAFVFRALRIRDDCFTSLGNF